MVFITQPGKTERERVLTEENKILWAYTKFLKACRKMGVFGLDPKKSRKI